MNTAETIQYRIERLPLAAQQEVLKVVEQIEQRYQSQKLLEQNGEKQAVYPLSLLAQIQIDGPPDLAERHDYYAHSKLED